ncbi:MAG TPA: hypothetical protein VNA20_16135 [Frankiaceae bacterium]|nr:hypothetical protein [Frankiaceae bacterium]
MLEVSYLVAASEPTDGGADGGPARRGRRAAATVAASAAIVASGAGLLAAQASWNADFQERSRTIATTDIRSAMHRLSLDAADLNERHIATTEALVRVGAARQRLAAAPPADRPPLQEVVVRWRHVADRIDRAQPLSADETLARGYAPAVAAQQRADRHAGLADKWTRRSDANIATAGLVAVAVLLVAPALTAGGMQRPYLLIAVGFALVAHGCTRLVVTNAEAPAAVSDAAIAAFMEGTVQLELGNPGAAAEEFVRAVTVDPAYAAAWIALGDTYLVAVDARTPVWAVEAYERAIELDPPTATLLNNLAYAELLAGRTEHAAAHAQQAVTLLPRDLRVAATAAEVLVAAGERRAALAAANTLIARLADESETSREDIFSALRTDERDLAAVGVGAALREEFYGRLRRAAATLEAFGRAEPQPAGRATTAISLRYDEASLRMRYELTCRGARRDDRLGVRVYRDTMLVASAVHETATPTCRVAADLPVDPGAYTVEVYVNGNLSKTVATFFKY